MFSKIIISPEIDLDMLGVGFLTRITKLWDPSKTEIHVKRQADDKEIWSDGCLCIKCGGGGLWIAECYDFYKGHPLDTELHFESATEQYYHFHHRDFWYPTLQGTDWILESLERYINNEWDRNGTSPIMMKNQSETKYGHTILSMATEVTRISLVAGSIEKAFISGVQFLVDVRRWMWDQDEGDDFFDIGSPLEDNAYQYIDDFFDKFPEEYGHFKNSNK